MKKVLPILTLLLVSLVALSQDKDFKKTQKAAGKAKTNFLKEDTSMDSLFNSAYGYVIFPKVTKGGLGVGGAGGKGIAYEGGQTIGLAKLSQLSIGFQAGGQTYAEVIFFENQEAMDRFKKNKVELSAQVSAVAAASGASANAKYVEGVAVFTMTKGGLMYEASVGGQQFKFEAM